MKITVLIPTLNEEKGIGPTLDALDRKAFEERGWDLELLIVDGASKDRTREEATARGARVVVEERRGYGRAYKRGFAEATGDYIVTADADGTYPLERAHLMVQAAIAGDVDFANGNRYADLAPGAMSTKHKFGNWVLSSTARLLFGARIKDSQSGMWIIRRAALSGIDLEGLSEGMAFSQEVKLEFFKRRDRKSVEVPAALRPRIGKPVLSSWRDGLGNLKGLVTFRLRRAW